MAEITLKELQNKFKDINDGFNTSVNYLDGCLTSINESLTEINKLMNERNEKLETLTDSKLIVQINKERSELLKYKSVLFQAKSEFTNEIDTIKTQIKSVNVVLDLIHKAIQLNTGEIF